MAAVTIHSDFGVLFLKKKNTLYDFIWKFRKDKLINMSESK